MCVCVDDFFLWEIGAVANDQRCLAGATIWRLIKLAETPYRTDGQGINRTVSWETGRKGRN